MRLVLSEGELDSGTGLETAVEVQAPQEYGGNEWTLFGGNCLEFNDGCQCYHLMHRQPEAGEAVEIVVGKDLKELGNHVAGDLLFGNVTRKHVGLGEQVALECCRGDTDVTNQFFALCRDDESSRVGDACRRQQGSGLHAGKAFGNGDAHQFEGSIEQVFENSSRRQIPIEGIVTGFQAPRHAT